MLDNVSLICFAIAEFLSETNVFTTNLACQARWGWMKGELMDEFRGQDMIVSGDGQCDSPGFSGKNLCYSIMEVSSEYILQVQIVDKRHVALVSSNMKVEGLKRSLKNVQEDMNIVELVTDPSLSVKKLLGRFEV